MYEIKNKRVYRYLYQDGSDSLNAIRSILLFGKNTSTYKFALCESFLLAGPKQTITYEEMLPAFVDALLRHANQVRKQNTAPDGGTFMKACLNHLDGNISRRELDLVAYDTVHRYVFDAFQAIGGGRLNYENMLFDFDKRKKILTLRDGFLSVLGNPEHANLIRTENESRWRLVEEAWRTGISTMLIQYNRDDGSIFYESGDLRVNLRSAIDALMPYQKDKCFYCEQSLNRFAINGEMDFPEVDHFLPLARLSHSENLANPNGVWNLVISCLQCNRGKSGKFDKIPHESFFESLVIRNEYFAEEHRHGMRLGVLSSLGLSDFQSSLIRDRIKSIYDLFSFETTWKPKVANP
jgi:hypothetical protein